MTLMLLAVVILRYYLVLRNEIVMMLDRGNVLIITANGPAVKLVYVAERMKAGAEKPNRGRSRYQP
jgi:hypothetical protein